VALSKQQLATRIVTEMEALGAAAAGEHSWVQRFADAIAAAVVDEIQANAQDSQGGPIS
jgi:hypothetical protein